MLTTWFTQIAGSTPFSAVKIQFAPKTLCHCASLGFVRSLFSFVWPLTIVHSLSLPVHFWQAVQCLPRAPLRSIRWTTPKCFRFFATAKPTRSMPSPRLRFVTISRSQTVFNSAGSTSPTPSSKTHSSISSPRITTTAPGSRSRMSMATTAPTSTS